MSVASCIRNATAKLSNEAIEELTARVDKFTKLGATFDEASQMAFAEFFTESKNEYLGLLQQVNDQGGVVQVGDAASFTPAWSGAQPATAEMKTSTEYDGLPVRDDGRVELTHYSAQKDLLEIDPTFHGKGRAGAEKRRKQNDPGNWVDRTYYGIAVGQEGGYKKEAGLGNYEYKTSVAPQDLYNMDTDPDGLLAQAQADKWGNTQSVYERLIRDAGYKGYWTDHPSMGKVAAVFEVMPVETDINFTPIQQGTDEFKQWFSNSKGIDDDGTPTRFYHITKGDFDTFTPGGTDRWYNGQIVKPGDPNYEKGGIPSGPAIWFTDDAESQPAAHNVGGYQGKFAEGTNVMPVYLRMKNPLWIDDETSYEWAREVFSSGKGSAFPQILTTEEVMMLMEEGYDSIIFKPKEFKTTPQDWQNEYVVFDTTQVKSAIGNKGTFDSTENNINFSLPEGETWFEPEPTFETPTEVSMKDKFLTAIVDKFHSLTKTMKKIGAVTEEEDVDNAVVRYPGMARARIDDFELEHQQELMDLIQESGLSFEEAAKFLHARHANEANEVLKRRNPDRADNEALSGMSNEEAQQILDQYADNQAAQNIGLKVDQMNNERLDQMVEDEILSPAEAQSWRDNYSHYVPLHREDIGTDTLPRRGKGFDSRGKMSEIRAGSTRPVDYENMFAHMIAQHENFIVRGEKNRVAQTMYNLAANHANPDMWTTDEALMSQKAYRKADGTIGYRPDYANPNGPTLVAKFNGENRYVEFNMDNPHAKQILSAMKNLDSQSTNVITRTLLQLNRYLSSINTSLSPEFVISNFFRDAQTAFYNLTDTEVKDLEGKIIKNIPSALRGIRNGLRGDGSHEWAQYFDEFRKAGAMTGWMQSYDDIGDRMKAIERSLKYGNKWGFKHIKGLGKFISDYNTVVENAVRLSTYKNARDAGLSEAKAAKIAKEVTVNFNRRGEWALTANALYLFYNAAVQGSARLLRAVSNPKNHRLHKMVAATVATAALLDIVNRMVSGEDEDEKSKYDMVREKYGSRNLILMDFMDVTEDGFLKIPLPWGYNVFHVMGQEVGSTISHAMGDYPEWSAWKSVSRIGGSTLEAFNPVQDGSLLQTISPTILDPVVRVSENKDWHGGPLYPNYNQNADNYTKFYGTARDASRSIAEWMAETTRLDDSTPVVDVSPEWLDMTWDFYTGAVGRFAADTLGMTKKLVKGEAWEYKEFPITRKVVGNVAPSDVKMEFYEEYYKILDLDSRVRKQVRDGFPEKAKAMRDSAGDRMKLVPMAKLTKKKLRKLKKQLNLAKKAGKTEAVNKLEKTQLRIMNQYLKQYRRVMYNQ